MHFFLKKIRRCLFYIKCLSILEKRLHFVDKIIGLFVSFYQGDKVTMMQILLSAKETEKNSLKRKDNKRTFFKGLC